MKICLSAFAIVLAISSLAVAQDEPVGEHEAIVKDMLSVIEQITEALKTVNDEETSAAAKPALQKAAELWTEVRKKADAIKPPTQADREKLEGYASKFVVAQKQLFAQISRVISVPGGREVLREVRAVLSPTNPKR